MDTLTVELWQCGAGNNDGSSFHWCCSWMLLLNICHRLARGLCRQTQSRNPGGRIPSVVHGTFVYSWSLRPITIWSRYRVSMVMAGALRRSRIRRGKLWNYNRHPNGLPRGLLSWDVAGICYWSVHDIYLDILYPMFRD